MTTTWLVLALLAGYVAIMTLTARKSAVGKRTVFAYTVAEREVPATMGGLSLAATWVWATGLFVSSLHAYNVGWVGVVWFTVPNTLAILIMLPFALMLRRKYPHGLTLSGFMHSRYGTGVMRLYHLTLGGLAILATALNYMAGGAVLSFMTGTPAWLWSILLAAATLVYTYRYGLRSSAGTGAVQMVFILATIVTAAVYAVHAAGTDVLAAGIGGMKGVTSFFGDDGQMVALSFGIVTAVGLVAGPVGDPTFWQRAYSYKQSAVKPAFFLAAAAFVGIPVGMSVLGYIGAGKGMTPSGAPDYINLDVAAAFLPDWLLVAFLFTILSALLSTANSMLVSLGSLASDYTASLDRQRVVVAVAAAVAVVVSLVPGLTLFDLFLIYSTLRSATFLITVTTILGKTWNARATFWAIAAGLVVGFPATIYGNVIGSTWQWKLGALLLTSVLPLVIVAVWTAIRPAGVSEGERRETPGETAAAVEASRV